MMRALTLNTKIYHKPTHTDQYLNWDSNHHLEHKRLVVRTLLHRTETVVSEHEDVKKEVKHVTKMLTVMDKRTWSGLFRSPREKLEKRRQPTEGPTASKHRVCIPYMSALSVQLQRVLRSHGIPSYHELFNTIRSLTVSPKDKSKKEKQCRVVYSDVNRQSFHYRLLWSL